MMKELVLKLREGGFSCVIANGADVRTFTQRGIADLYDLSMTDPDFLKGACVADKVVGMAAAALMIDGGVAKLHADLISESALNLLAKSNVQVEFVRSVHHIENRDKSDWCPLEKSCNGITSIGDILPIIDNFIATIRGKSLTTLLQ